MARQIYYYYIDVTYRGRTGKVTYKMRASTQRKALHYLYQKIESCPINGVASINIHEPVPVSQANRERAMKHKEAGKASAKAKRDKQLMTYKGTEFVGYGDGSVKPDSD